MSPPRPDPLDVIYEDDETDEGAISPDGGTSLHGHPDHEHADEDVRALAAENVLLRENVNALVREVACADAEMVRWRSRCRKIEDERDALSRELDRCKVELERRTRPQPMVVYSTADNVPRLEQSPPMYHPGNTPGSASSPPQRFASPRIHTLSPGYSHPSLPAIAVSPTYDPTPAGAGVPTHRGRLAPPRTAPSPKPRTSSREREHERKREMNRREQVDQSRLQERDRNHLSWEQARLDAESSARFEKAHRDREQAQREMEQARQEWEHVQFARENPSPVVYSTGTPEGWSYFDMPRQGDWTNTTPSTSFVPAAQSMSLASPGSPTQGPLIYSSAYPHPNGHGQGRHVLDEGPHGRHAVRQDGATILSPRQAPRKAHSPLRTQVRLQPPQHPQPKAAAPDRPEPRRAPANDVPAPPGSGSSQGSASSAGSHEAPPGDAPPRTPPDAAAPAPFALSPTSAAFSPAGLQFQPVVDPEFGPVIVHGPLPPRHEPAPPRRKREPASVPPRHLTGGKGGGAGFGGAAFGGAAMGMGGGVTLTMGPERDGWAWGRR